MHLKADSSVGTVGTCQSPRGVPFNLLDDSKITRSVNNQVAVNLEQLLYSSPGCLIGDSFHKRTNHNQAKQSESQFL